MIFITSNYDKYLSNQHFHRWLIFVISITLATLIKPITNQQQAAINSPCPRAYLVNVNYQFRGTLHFICLQPTKPNPTLDVIQFNDRKLIFSKAVNEIGTQQLSSFVDDDGILRILFAIPHKANGTSVYSIHPNGSYSDETHTVNTQFVSAVNIWRSQLNLEWQLVVANKPSYETALSNNNNQQLSRIRIKEMKPIITFYSWRATYFDHYDQIDLPKDGQVNKLEPMNVNGQEFLVIAMEPYQTDLVAASTSINSLIYKLDFSDGNLKWIKFQPLETKFALDVKSFHMTHQGSLQKDYYIALLGKPAYIATSNIAYKNQMVNNNNTRQYDTNNDIASYGLAIYKYFGDKFIFTHITLTDGATKLDTISYGNGDSYVIIALLSQWTNQISLFVFDGLDLKQIQSPFQQQKQQPLVGMSASNRPPQQLLFGKPKRTLDSSTNLHLFMVPPTVEGEQSNEGTYKRTLNEDNQFAEGIPALAFSDPNLNYDSSNNDREEDALAKKANSIESLYEIPVKTIIEPSNTELNPIEAQSNETSINYNKRGGGGPSFVASEMLDWCRSSLSSILQDDLESSSQILRQLPRVDQLEPIHLYGDLFVEDNLHVSNLLYANRIVERTNSTLNLNNLKGHFTKAFHELQQLQNEINDHIQLVNQILVDDGSLQEVYTNIKFDNILIDCLDSGPPTYIGKPCAYVNQIRTSYLNGKDISNLQQKVYITGRPTVIDRDIRFEHLVLENSISILGSINGLQIDDIVFARGPSTGPIIGPKTFKNGLYSKANLVIANWNGRSVNRSNYLTSTGEQYITSKLRFSRVILDPPANQAMDRTTFTRLNNIYLDNHLSQIALTDSKNLFDVPVTFDELILNGDVQLSPNALLSSHNIEAVFSSTLFKNIPQNVSAPIEFLGGLSVVQNGHITVDGLVNRIPFVRGNILMQYDNLSIYNPIIFDHEIKVHQLELAKSLNGIQIIPNHLTNRTELSILYDGGEQILSSHKIFNDVQLGGYSTIGGRVNGNLDLDQLFKLVNNNGQPYRFTNIRLSGNNIRFSNRASVNIAFSINGIPTNDLCSFANRVSNIQSNHYKRIRFEKRVNFKSLYCHSINGFNNLNRYFLTRRGNQSVAGTLKLVNGAIFNSSISISSSLNGMNIGPLSRAVSRANEEFQTGLRDISGDLIVDDLITRQINDLVMANVFLARSDIPQIVRAPVTFNDLLIENVLVVNNLIAYSFNGLNVTDLIANTLQYDTHQVIYNHVHLNNLQILHDSNLITPQLNGHNLGRLYSDAVLVDVPQQILARKTFTSPVEFTNRVFIRNGIDGISESELKFNLLLQSDELIDGDLEFNNDVVIKKELEIQTGVINDIDINMFVDNMLYENRPNRRALTIGNGSVRFKDVKVNNLVVAGTVQGIDLSKEGLFNKDNMNGSYDSKLREQEIMNNHQRILNSVYGSGARFPVAGFYRNEHLMGSCYIHSCPKTTNIYQISQTTVPMNWQYSTTVRPQQYQPEVTPRPSVLPHPYPLVNQAGNMQPHFAHYNQTWTTTTHHQQYPMFVPQPQPQRPSTLQQTPVYLQNYIPNLPPKPVSLINISEFRTVWQPKWEVVTRPANVLQNLTTNLVNRPIVNQLTIDPSYLEYQTKMQIQAIRDLTLRVNRYLSISFYYEISQTHPLLGPLLHAAKNPMPNERSSSLLILKATGKYGEPCLLNGQTIAVMAQDSQRGTFVLSSQIRETTNPITVKSLVIGQDHYLIILDRSPNEPLMSQVVVYIWDKKLGMYEPSERIAIDGIPTAMEAFRVNELGCIGVANPNRLSRNITGSPVIYCQTSVKSRFNHQTNLAINNVFDMDIITLPRSNEIILATLSRQDTEKIRDLSVSMFNIVTGTLKTLAIRRLIKPLKLHLFRNSKYSLTRIHLAVAEAITSNDGTQAITRIFTMNLIATQSGTSFILPNAKSFYESQILRDNQFYDIQSVYLDNSHSMLFLQSVHSISVYAPTSAIGLNVSSGDLSPELTSMAKLSGEECSDHFTLVQRLPTKGANKFLVFNDHQRDSYSSSLAATTTNDRLYGHFLVLSREDCEKQQFSTIILKAKFK